MAGNKTIHRLIMILCIFVLFHWIMLLILNYVPLGVTPLSFHPHAGRIASAYRWAVQ